MDAIVKTQTQGQTNFGLWGSKSNTTRFFNETRLAAQIYVFAAAFGAVVGWSTSYLGFPLVTFVPKAPVANKPLIQTPPASNILDPSLSAPGRPNFDSPTIPNSELLMVKANVFQTLQAIAPTDSTLKKPPQIGDRVPSNVRVSLIPERTQTQINQLGLVTNQVAVATFEYSDRVYILDRSRKVVSVFSLDRP